MLISVMLQIIERGLPKKQKVKKDPSAIEREENEKISKYWVNIARKEIPRHHRIFTNFYRKQITDAKRVSETCQKEVCASATYVVVAIQFIMMNSTFLSSILALHQSWSFSR